MNRLSVAGWPARKGKDVFKRIMMAMLGLLAAAHAAAAGIDVTLAAPNGVSYKAPATIALSATAVSSDPSAPITRVLFQAGTSVLAVLGKPPYDFTWTNVPAGTYTVTAMAINLKGASATSAPVNLSVTAGGNTPPTVQLTSPANNAGYNAPTDVTLTANAFDSDGTVAKVEFYNGSTLIGTATAVPYTLQWSNVGPGKYVITAKATDDQGAATASAPVTITVNAPPTISLTAPQNNATVSAPADITLTANASDSDGSISQVAFYNGTAFIGSTTGAPYSLVLPNVPAGSYSVTAVATDNLGASATSAAVYFTVSPPANVPPTVGLSADPANAAAPATVTLTATASDADGVAKVEFFNGTTLLATVTQPPYAYQWTNVGAGSYAVTAKATDNLGAGTVSSPVTVVVSGTAVAQQLYYIHSDHLNTPRVITDSANNVVWRWDNSEPFGNNLPVSQGFEFNLRFPGQYFDKETNLHYNYFRDYDPSTSRYIESDPIGLFGGINTFTYAANQPTRYTDPRGLDNPGMGPYGPLPYRPGYDQQPTEPGLATVCPECGFIPLLRLPRILDIFNKNPKQDEPQICPGSDKQFGRKYGEHRDPDKPGYRSHDEYRDRANEIYNDPNATRTTYPGDASKYPGETHIQSGNDLLRLDPSGNFRSLYPIGP